MQSLILGTRGLVVGLSVTLAGMSATDGRAMDPSDSVSPAAESDVDFAKQIAPLLQSRCLGCHGPQKAKSGLRLDSVQSAMQGGFSGEAIKPGNSGDSRLVHVVAGTDEDEIVMPPEPNTRLTKEEIGLLRAWIDQGARWPKGLVLTLKQRTASRPADDHWSFQPLRRSAIPAVQQQTWVRNPIDRFVFARLEAERLNPAPEASHATLIRRVSLDLIGLPPSPAEVADFVSDSRSDAYERLVDRLLASPHYGEKWAGPWLDLCHYADTDGYLTDQARPVAWRYRHWLITALNQDLPFDRFTVQQLAGDLLPDATVEQRMATGFLRNTLSNREGGADLEEFRVEQVVDRTQMVGTAWLGLTVGCARCHDHKYDPVSQQEFYQLYAYFDSADEVNIDAPLPGEWEAHQAKLPEYQQRRTELLRPVQSELAELQARWEQKLLHAAAHPSQDATWYRKWELLGLTWGGWGPDSRGEGQLEGTQIIRLDPSERTQDQQDRLLEYFLGNGGLVDPQRFLDLELEELLNQLRKLNAQLPTLTRAPVMRDTPIPRTAFVHVRGDFRRPGPPVEPRTPACLPPLPDAVRGDRLALAQWLVSVKNPLPARVTVNRFWQEFFGRGLVVTSDNFGTQGEQPTHPELLDWLAVEFREGGWSMKAVHRLIVTSATYRQSSRVRPELLERDPNNRLLARQASLRLSAGQVRDVSLAVSGLLNRKIGGPSVFPPQPDSVAKEGFENRWQVSAGSDRYRRGLYTFLQRLSPFAQSVTFDAPSLSRSCTRRERSNTPLQALTLLNDPVFFEAAQAFAARILREQPGDADERIDYAFELALSRPPRAGEKQRLSSYYKEQLALFSEEPSAVPLLSPPQLADGNAAEPAAWTCVCSVLLNLHEFITRE